MSARELPPWQEGSPETGAICLCFSTNEKRNDAPFLSHWDGSVWQMLMGWYDHGVSHWIDTGERTAAALPPPPQPRR